MAALTFHEQLKTLPPISVEQRHILANLDNNVLVDSVAGSGKTTCVLYAACVLGAAKPHERILLLTYNKKLRQETRLRCEAAQITNLEVHTYHSFTNAYYRTGCGTDIVMNEVLASDTKPIHSFAYNRIIIDESQDMTALYFQLVSRIVMHNRIVPQTEPRIVRYDGREYITQVLTEPKFMVIGDKHQSIFTFNDADYRFVTLAPEVFKFNGLPWRAAKLTTSYRITIPIANFLNKAILHQDRLIAVKPSNIKPKYFICNIFSKAAVGIVTKAIKKYGVENIFVLASSVKSSKSPVIRTINQVSKSGHLIYVAGQEETVDQAASAGKLVVASYHQVKGLERKCVIIMGMDDGFYIYGNKNLPKHICPNVFYVALTRAKEELIMIHSQTANFLPFINVEKLRETCEVTGEIAKIIEQPKLGQKQYAATDLIRHLSSSTMIATGLYIDDTPGPIQYHIRLPDKINGASLDQVESVTEINGVVIPAYFQYFTTGKISILDIIKTREPRFRIELSSPNSDSCIEEITQIAVKYGCIMSKYTYKERQLPHFKWLDRATVGHCIGSMAKFITPNSEFEITLPSKIVNGVVITGVADVIDHTPVNGRPTLWELKCCSEIKREHMLQLGIYAYLCGDIYNYKILNITTGEVRELKWNTTLVDLVELIVNAKISDPSLPNDDEFVKYAAEIRQNTKLKLTERKEQEPERDETGPASASDLLF
jgi:hypothetical protein